MQQFFLKATVCMTAALMPSSNAFKTMSREEIMDLTNDPEMQRLSLINEIGTAPCVFKLDENFYDFTPIKLANPKPTLSYFDGTV